MLVGLLLAAVIVIALLLWRVVVSASRNLPKAGDTAPSFDLPDQHGKPRTLEEFRGRWLVLYFYPRDDTPQCAEQAARYRDVMRDIEALSAVVCGVSVNDTTSHAAFALKYKLPFALLADRGGNIAARYGSLTDLGIVKFARRNTFLIDPHGKIAKVYVGVNAARNARDVTADLVKLACP